MASTFRQLLVDLERINTKKDKSSEDKELLDDIIQEILEKRGVLRTIPNNPEEGSKWNPSIPDAFSKHLTTQCRLEGLTEVRKQLLIQLLRSNHRGVWLSDLCGGLSLLLGESIPEEWRC